MASNCVASTSIGCLFCCQGCNAEKLRNDFTFLPPVPSYQVEGAAEGGRAGKLQFVLEALRSFSFYQQAAEHAEVHFVQTGRGERIPVVWVRNSAASTAGSPGGSSRSGQQPLVLLHCHGNATDIGMMMAAYFEMTRQLGCEVVGVEYSGYGASSGKPSACNTLADAEAAYNFVVSSGVPPERIIAYGQSVGSGPAMALAARKPMGGVVLHSPMLSGIRVIDPQPDSCCRPSCVFWCFDFFRNDKHIKAVKCPVFVMHGRMDDVIPLYHGVRLSEAAPKDCRWPGYFPKDAGHNDIIERNSAAYFGEVCAFLRSVQERVDGSGASLIGKPAQMKMVEVAAKGQGGTARPYAEPMVGPEDGRYESIRRAGGRTQGGSREGHGDSQAALD
mmetsp:Transcript_85367/g.237553  ORF Transcript_85367/g.237553 Transcript_85367/m.237553 type:complete len:388 (+) Transcript_85367:114-1277(+)